MDFRHLRHFVVVAEELNFRRAATRLGIEQSPLSRSIQELEDQLRAPLLLRTSRGSHLTPAGEALLPDARAILELVAGMKNRARELHAGRAGLLRIGVCDSLANRQLSALLITLRSRHPALSVEVVPINTTQAITAAETGQVDVSFAFGVVDSDTTTHVQLWAEWFDVAVATENALAAQDVIAVSTVAEASEILVTEAWAGAAESWLHAISAIRQVDVPPVRVMRSYPTLVTAVGSELGIALVPSGLAGSLARPDIRVRQIGGRTPRIPVALVFRSGHRHVGIDALREIAAGSATLLSAATPTCAAPVGSPDPGP